MVALKAAEVDSFVARPSPERPIVLVCGPDAGLVHGERRSKWVYYSLDRGRLASLRAAIDS